MYQVLAYLCPLSIFLLCSAAFIASSWGFDGRGLAIAKRLLLTAILGAGLFLAAVEIEVFPSQH